MKTWKDLIKHLTATTQEELAWKVSERLGVKGWIINAGNIIISGYYKIKIEQKGNLYTVGDCRIIG